MKLINKLSSPGRRRLGTAVVELAVVLPVLLIMLVGAIEIGRGISVNRTCSQAARAGARVYSMRKDKTEVDVRAIVDQIMEESNFTNYAVTLDPVPSPDIEQLDPLTVTVSINVADSTWQQTPWFFKANSSISSSCTMPADLGETAEEDMDTPPVVDTEELIDDDPKSEGSGVTEKELKDLEKDVEKQVKKARKAREDAEKQAEKVDKAIAKATESGDPKDWDKVAKEQQKYDEKVAEADAEEALARELLQVFTTATAGYSSP